MTDKQSLKRKINTPTKLGLMIKNYRKDAGLSQIELAKLVGPEMRQSWISQFETGVRVPNGRLIHALCKALRVSKEETPKLILQASCAYANLSKRKTNDLMKQV